MAYGTFGSGGYIQIDLTGLGTYTLTDNQAANYVSYEFTGSPTGTCTAIMSPTSYGAAAVRGPFLVYNNSDQELIIDDGFNSDQGFLLAGDRAVFYLDGINGVEALTFPGIPVILAGNDPIAIGGSGLAGNFTDEGIFTSSQFTSTQLQRAVVYASCAASGYTGDTVDINFTCPDSGYGFRTLTNVDVTSNVLTIDLDNSSNSFIIGSQIYISNVATATYLNGRRFVILSATTTQITAGTTDADDPSHADTGNVYVLRGQSLISSMPLDNDLDPTQVKSAQVMFKTNSDPSNRGTININHNYSTGDTAIITSNFLTGNVATFNVDDSTNFNTGDRIYVSGNINGGGVFNSAPLFTIASSDNTAPGVITVNITHADVPLQGEHNAKITNQGIKKVTATQLTSNVATFTCVNDYKVGQHVVITGVTVNPTVYNSGDFSFIIKARTGTNFTVAITHANIGLQAEANAYAFVTSLLSFDARAELLQF